MDRYYKDESVAKSRKGRLIDVGIVSLVIFTLSLIIFRRYIFGGYYFLSKEFLGDSLRVSLPTYYHLYDNLFGGEGGFWSWRMGIGTSMFSHGEFFFDPFTYIVFLGGRDHIPGMMIWCFVARIIAMGSVFCVYLSHFKLRREALVLASVAYAFCGSSLITGDFFQESPILIYFPLICLGIEKWLDENKKSILIVGLFLNAIYTFYYYFIACIVIFIYLWGRMCFRHDRGQIIMRSVRLIGYEALGLCMGGFSVLPQVDVMLHSPRVLGNNDIEMGIGLFKPYISTLVTAVVRMMGLNILMDSSGGFLGTAYVFNDYCQLTTYTSAFIIIFLFQLIYIKKEYRKRIILYGILGAVLILVPFFSFLVNAFSTINYRWIFIILLAEGVAIAFAIDAILECGHIPVAGTTIGAVVSIGMIAAGVLILGTRSGDVRAFLYEIKKGSFVYIATVFIGCILFVFFAVLLKYRPRMFCVGVCFLLMCADIVINAGYMYGDTEDSIMEYSEKNNACYSDTSAKIISELRENDRDFYRVNKDFDSVVCTYDQNSCNDAMVQGYYGLKSYNSINNANYINYLWKNDIYVTPAANVEDYRRLGVAPSEVWNGQELNYIEGVYDRYDLMSYLGVKYYLTRVNDKRLPDSFEMISEEDGIFVYKNRAAYPLAFIEDNDVSDMQNSFNLRKFSADNVVIDLDVKDNSSELIFSIPYDRDWHIYIDGIETEHKMKDNFLLCCMVGPGKHEVRLKYIPIALYAGLVLSIITVTISGIAWAKFSRKTQV